MMDRDEAGRAREMGWRRVRGAIGGRRYTRLPLPLVAARAKRSVKRITGQVSRRSLPVPRTATTKLHDVVYIVVARSARSTPCIPRPDSR